MYKDAMIRFYPPTEQDLSSPLYVVWASTKEVSPSKYMGFRTIEFYVLIYIMSGSGTVYMDNDDGVVLTKGALFVIPPNTRHCLQSDPNAPWDCYTMCFGGYNCEGILSRIGIDRKHFYVHSKEGIATKICMDAVSHLGDKAMDSFAILGSLHLIFSEIKRLNGADSLPEDARKQIVTATVEFICNYYYLHIDVDMLCDYIKYSRSYLSRLFNNEMGVTIPEYINQVRISHAKKLFEETTLSVQEVSSSVGIFDSFYFSKTFKKAVGLSPNQYKKQFRLQPKCKTAVSET